MRCFICDSQLADDSIHWNSDYEEWDPCPTCLLAIAEVFEDHLEEDEITWLLEQEDEDFFEEGVDFP